MEGLRVSHYRLLRRLGSGGMGEVYAAEDERLRRQVAIKFISRERAVDEPARRRFEREAQAASALNHGPHARLRGVTQRHSTDESLEQGRTARRRRVRREGC